MNHKIENTLLPLVTTLSIQAIVSMTAATVPVFAPVAAKDININPTYIGVYVALIYIGGMLSSLISGDIVSRYGAIRVSQGCLILCAIGIALTFIGNILFMVISALLIGFGYGPITPASSHILIKTTPVHKLSMMFSLKQTGVPVGGALAGALVPVLVLYVRWENTALIVGAMCLIMAFLAEPMRKIIDDDRDMNRHINLTGFTAPFKLVFHQKNMRAIIVLSFFFATLQLCLTTYLVTYLTKSFSISLILAGLTLSVSQVAGIFGRIFWGIIADRYVQPRRLLGCLGVLMTLSAIASGMFNLSWPFAMILAISALFGSAAIGWNGVYLAEIARLSPAGKTGVATGGALFFTYLGVVVGPPVFAAIVSVTGSYAVSYITISVPVFLNSVLLLAGHNSAKKVEYVEEIL